MGRGIEVVVEKGNTPKHTSSVTCGYGAGWTDLGELDRAPVACLCGTFCSPFA